MNLTVNGQSRSLASPILTLDELLAELGLSGQPLLVEHNGQALHPAQQRELRLQDGDQLELLRMVAGG